jgi:hypothetical protein
MGAYLYQESAFRCKALRPEMRVQVTLRGQPLWQSIRMGLDCIKFFEFASIRGGNTKMFGQMQVINLFRYSKPTTVDEAVAKLLQFADYPDIVRWFQFPTAVVILLAHDDEPDCGAIYVFDRKRNIWFWVDFDDSNYGGYSASEFDVLIKQCHFFQLVECPRLLESSVQWLVTPGQRPTVLGRLPT